MNSPCVCNLKKSETIANFIQFVFESGRQPINKSMGINEYTVYISCNLRQGKRSSVAMKKRNRDNYHGLGIR